MSAEPASERRPQLALSERGRWILLAGLTWTASGLLLGLPPITGLGLFPLVLLSGCFAAARVARARLALGAITIDIVGTPDPRIPLGRRLVTKLSITVATGGSPDDIELAVGAATPLTVEIDGEGAERSLSVEPTRVGEWWVHGFHVTTAVVGQLFRLRLWVATPRRFVGVPRHFPQRTDMSLRATRSSLQEHSGLSNRRRRGLGLEIRELRDFQAGDPFKHIAWRASARRGKLISREFESELLLSVWILVDVSPSMFWGQPGEARVDYAIETAYNLASVLLGGKDRAGLMAYDDRVRLQVSPAAQRGQLGRILNTLLEIPHLVHEERTELTNRELTEQVARWFVTQRGTSFALPDGLVQGGSPRLSQYDEGRLIEHAQEILQKVASERRRGPLLPFDDYAADYQRSLLRAFCRHVGIVLPLDPTPQPKGQALGLEAAMHAVMASRGGPHTVIIISDFYTADDLDAMRRIAVAARRRRHTLIVFCPDDGRFDHRRALPSDPLERAILETERLRVRQNLQAAQAVLKPAGTTFISVGPDDALARVLAKLRLVA